jgi:hypothetical protein
MRRLALSVFMLAAFLFLVTLEPLYLLSLMFNAFGAILR